MMFNSYMRINKKVSKQIRNSLTLLKSRVKLFLENMLKLDKGVPKKKTQSRTPCSCSSTWKRMTPRDPKKLRLVKNASRTIEKGSSVSHPKIVG